MCGQDAEYTFAEIQEVETMMPKGHKAKKSSHRMDMKTKATTQNDMKPKISDIIWS